MAPPILFISNNVDVFSAADWQYMHIFFSWLLHLAVVCLAFILLHKSTAVELFYPFAVQSLLQLNLCSHTFPLWLCSDAAQFHCNLTQLQLLCYCSPTQLQAEWCAFGGWGIGGCGWDGGAGGMTTFPVLGFHLGGIGKPLDQL